MISPNPYFNSKPYVPATLSEIDDLLGSMVFNAPTFVDRLGEFDWSIDSEFHALTEGFALVRKKLGEERYAALMEMATRAKQLFAADQDDSNGKTIEGRTLLMEMQDVLTDVRRGRTQAKLLDDEGEITGD